MNAVCGKVSEKLNKFAFFREFSKFIIPTLEVLKIFEKFFFEKNKIFEKLNFFEKIQIFEKLFFLKKFKSFVQIFGKALNPYPPGVGGGISRNKGWNTFATPFLGLEAPMG